MIKLRLERNIISDLGFSDKANISRVKEKKKKKEKNLRFIDDSIWTSACHKTPLIAIHYTAIQMNLHC